MAEKKTCKQKCKRCGQCCEFIPMWPDSTKDFYRSVVDNPRAPRQQRLDARFIVDNWHVIRRVTGKVIIYRCKLFDRKTKLCKAYGSRPSICRGYPLYGRKKIPTHIWPRPGCGFGGVR